MAVVSLKAHFDGTNIQLDEPFELPRDAQLLVTVLSSADDPERLDWTRLAAEALERAYGSDEPEYSVDDIRP